MRLPQHLIESQFFNFHSIDEFVAALNELTDESELTDIRRLSSLSLPPVTSRHALATLIGVNPGFVWSLENRTRRHYREFEIPKGKGVRTIFAPKIGLKIVQKWLSVQIGRKYIVPNHVYGFVPGRSHIKAAEIHCEAKWVYNVDIKNFFPSTPWYVVFGIFRKLGYNNESSMLLSRICCLNEVLAQGAPTSPMLSNFALEFVDVGLSEISEKYRVRLTRYADDVVFSGTETFNEAIIFDTNKVFIGTPWTLAPEKTRLSVFPTRLKVHGLLVHGATVRLTKGYRNRIRAFKHILANGACKEEDLNIIRGHLLYGSYVDSVIKAKLGSV